MALASVGTVLITSSSSAATFRVSDHAPNNAPAAASLFSASSIFIHCQFAVAAVAENAPQCSVAASFDFGKCREHDRIRQRAAKAGFTTLSQRIAAHVEPYEEVGLEFL